MNLKYLGTFSYRRFIPSVRSQQIPLSPHTSSSCCFVDDFNIHINGRMPVAFLVPQRLKSEPDGRVPSVIYNLDNWIMK